MRQAPAFDAFYLGTRMRTVHQMYAMLGDLAEAEDVTQEAYGRAWSQWAQVSQMADPQAWVRTVAWRLAANRLRHLWRAARRYPRQPLAAPQEPAFESVAVLEALRALPADQRRDVVLFYLVDLPVDRIAQETGSTPSAVKSRLSRGRTRLAGLLQDELEVDGHG